MQTGNRNGVNLFLSSLDEITFEHIKEFCEEKFEECETIDYKEDFNRETDKIVKTVAAMANTDGGIILIGVPEIRDNNKKRSLPREPKGIPIPKENIKQQIAHNCCAHLQPAFIPEIKEIETDNKDKVILLIRINKSTVPALPIFHVQFGINIRIGENIVPASPSHIRLLFEENEKMKQRLFKDYEYIKYSLEGFCWCNLNIELPTKRFTNRILWHGDQIEKIKRIMENHQIDPMDRVGGTYTWTQKYHPEYKMTTRNTIDNLENISIFTTPSSIKFAPRSDNKPNQSRDKTWFNVIFHTDGLISMAIGFNWNENLYVENIINAFFTVLDLLEKQTIRECFEVVTWDMNNYRLIFDIQQFPGFIECSYLRPEKPISFRTSGSSFGGPQYAIETKTINAYENTKEIMKYLLPEIGFWKYENSLAFYNIKEHYSQL